MKKKVKKKDKKRKVYSWTRLVISHSDRPQPCGSAVADLGDFSGNCSSFGPENRISALGGEVPSLPLLSVPQNGSGLTKDWQAWCSQKCLSPAFNFIIPLSPPSPGSLWVEVTRTPGTDGTLPVTGDSEGDKKHIFDHFFTKQTQDV